MKRNRLAAIGLLILAAFLVVAAGPPSRAVTQWARGTTATGVSLSVKPKDSLVTAPVDIYGMHSAIWTFRGDSAAAGVVPAARCSAVVFEVSQTGHDTSWVAATGLVKLDSLTTRNLNARPSWFKVWGADSAQVAAPSYVALGENYSCPWHFGRITLYFYGLHARNLRDLAMDCMVNR